MLLRQLEKALLTLPNTRVQDLGVGTGARTARHVRLCGAFGGRLALSLASLAFVAVSSRVGGLSGLFSLCRQRNFLDFLGQHPPQ